MRYVKVPTGLTVAPYLQRELKLNNFTVVESCTHTQGRTGSMYLEEHLLLFVTKGKIVIKHGETEYIVRENEMILMKKAMLIEYFKSGDPEQDNIYDSMMFFLKDEFIQDFIKVANIQSVHTEECAKISVKPVKERLIKFFDSIKPYFDESENIDAGLIKLKMLELLYDISATDKQLLQQLLQMKQQVRADLAEIMESNFMNPVSLPELAYLSGRSLASFKRDFQASYNMPPSKWIRNKRLNKAKDALENTSMSVADICYSFGFENTAHFSRIFKEHFGYAPSSIRQQVK
jgi:AraC-like DNA-binding protein